MRLASDYDGVQGYEAQGLLRGWLGGEPRHFLLQSIGLPRQHQGPAVVPLLDAPLHSGVRERNALLQRPQALQDCCSVY